MDTTPDDAATAAGAALRAGEAEQLAEAAEFRRHRVALQDEQLARLADRLPLPQLRLPYLFQADLGLTEIDLLADALLEGITALADLEPSVAAKK
jgi:hypothetical protein